MGIPISLFFDLEKGIELPINAGKSMEPGIMQMQPTIAQHDNSRFVLSLMFYTFALWKTEEMKQ